MMILLVVTQPEDLIRFIHDQNNKIPILDAHILD